MPRTFSTSLISLLLLVPSLYSQALSVRLFGAAGDGTTNDTAAVQAALNALPPGGELVFPASTGCYYITTITPHSHSTLSGPGCLLIHSDGTLADNSIYLNSVTDVTVRNLRITSDAAARTSVYGLIRSESSSSLSLSNLDLSGGSSTGIWTMNTSDFSLSHIRVHDMWADGVHISRGSKRGRISDLSCNYVGDDCLGLIGYLGGGGYWPAVADITADQVTVYNSTKLVGRGLAIYGCVHCAFSNFTIDTVYDAGVLIGAVGGSAVNSTHYSSDISLSNFTIRNPGAWGLYISFARSVHATNFRISSTHSDCVSVSFADRDISLAQIDASSCGGTGVTVSQTVSSDARLLAELYTALGDTAPASMGISDVTLDYVTVHDTASYGVFATSNWATPHISGFKLLNSHVWDITGYGLYTSYLDGAVYQGNNIDAPIYISRARRGTQRDAQLVTEIPQKKTTGIGASPPADSPQSFKGLRPPCPEIWNHSILETR